MPNKKPNPVKIVKIADREYTTLTVKNIDYLQYQGRFYLKEPTENKLKETKIEGKNYKQVKFDPENSTIFLENNNKFYLKKSVPGGKYQLLEVNYDPFPKVAGSKNKEKVTSHEKFVSLRDQRRKSRGSSVKALHLTNFPKFEYINAELTKISLLQFYTHHVSREKLRDNKSNLVIISLTKTGEFKILPYEKGCYKKTDFTVRLVLKEDKSTYFQIADEKDIKAYNKDPHSYWRREDMQLKREQDDKRQRLELEKQRLKKVKEEKEEEQIFAHYDTEFHAEEHPAEYENNDEETDLIESDILEQKEQKNKSVSTNPIVLEKPFVVLLREFFSRIAQFFARFFQRHPSPAASSPADSPADSPKEAVITVRDPDKKSVSSMTTLQQSSNVETTTISHAQSITHFFHYPRSQAHDDSNDVPRGKVKDVEVKDVEVRAAQKNKV